MKYLCSGFAAAAFMVTACETMPHADAKHKVEPSAQTLAISQSPETSVTAPIETEVPKYKKLVYGAEMPLVCGKTIAADGALENRPNLQVMWENYLYDRPEGIWGEIGGLVEVNGTLPFDQGRWTNACAVRVSHMLNKAGHKIPRDRPKTVSGGNKDQYYYRLADMETYLTRTYGEPDLAITDGSANSFDLPNAAGIVLMDFPNSGFTGHVTIWNGAGTVDGANIGGYRVLFWALPCFVPEGRNQASIVSKENANQSLTP